MTVCWDTWGPLGPTETKPQGVCWDWSPALSGLQGSRPTPSLE